MRVGGGERLAESGGGGGGGGGGRGFSHGKVMGGERR